jgi:hypothetical protein
MNKTVIGVGVVAAGGLAWYLYNKNKEASAASLQPQQYAPTPSAVLPSGTTAPAPTYTAPVSTAVSQVKQRIWKDNGGNIFELTNDMQKWGYVIKVNGAVHGKWNQMLDMALGPDGLVIGADNNGSVFQWKNNQWNYVIKDNKSQAKEYMAKLGVNLALNGLRGLNGFAGSAYLLT